MRILIVDEGLALADELTAELESDGHHVYHKFFLDNSAVLAMAKGTHLAILDPELIPSHKGYDLLRSLRAGSATMLLVLSRKAGIDERVEALEAGADDYLVKPIIAEELVARARALLRRHPLSIFGEHFGAVQVTADLWLNLAGRTLVGSGQEQGLTEREFRLLAYLVKHEGKVFSRKDLITAIWGDSFEGSAREIDVYVRYLRQKVEPDPGRPQHILTAWGRGYLYKRATPHVQTDNDGRKIPGRLTPAMVCLD